MSLHLPECLKLISCWKALTFALLFASITHSAPTNSSAPSLEYSTCSQELAVNAGSCVIYDVPNTALRVKILLGPRIPEKFNLLAQFISNLLVTAQGLIEFNGRDVALASQGRDPFEWEKGGPYFFKFTVKSDVAVYGEKLTYGDLLGVAQALDHVLIESDRENLAPNIFITNRWTWSIKGMGSLVSVWRPVSEMGTNATSNTTGHDIDLGPADHVSYS